MFSGAAAVYRINPGCASAVGSVEEDVDPVPDNRARIFWGGFVGIAESWETGRKKKAKKGKREGLEAELIPAFISQISQNFPVLPTPSDSSSRGVFAPTSHPALQNQNSWQEYSCTGAQGCALLLWDAH